MGRQRPFLARLQLRRFGVVTSTGRLILLDSAETVCKVSAQNNYVNENAFN